VDEWLILDEATLDPLRTLDTFAEVGQGVYDSAPNQVTYLDGLLEARFEPVGAPGYQVGLVSLDLDSDFVIDADFLEPEDFEEFERAVSSPPFEAADGSVRLPWFAIYFAGRHKFRVIALDDNWFDLVRTSPDFNDSGSFGGNAGEGFDRPLFRLDGAIGLFGSGAVDSIGIFVHPRE
jgi:hypothetical protein